MGLDMYLSATLEVGKYGNEEDKETGENIREIMPEIFRTGNLDSLEVKFEVGYWRKSNHIHAWFVKNCQDGKDECEDSDVERKQLIELRETCERVLGILSRQKKKKVMLKEKFSDKKYEHDVFPETEEIAELLPTTSGFFFGGTEYDEYYEGDIENTIKIINKCLKLPESWEFSYRSSW